METHNGQQHRPTTEFTVSILQPGHKMCSYRRYFQTTKMEYKWILKVVCINQSNRC